MSTPNPDQRITNLEERHGFTEHTVEQLSGELARAYKLIDRLHQRIADLERRIGVVETNASDQGATDPLELPPHSAGNRAELEESKRQAGYSPDD
ncbi:MAG: SlyX family protein [Phycisphaerales bacterium JB065]